MIVLKLSRKNMEPLIDNFTKEILDYAIFFDCPVCNNLISARFEFNTKAKHIFTRHCKHDIKITFND